MSKVSIVTTLTNWDGTLNKEDALYHLQRHISAVSGYTHLSVTFEKGILRVSHPQGRLLVVDFTAYGRELVGRVRHFGINLTMLEELEKIA